MTIKQHYVPQFYLRNFTSGDKKLWVFDKEKRNSIAVRQKVFVLRSFYMKRLGKMQIRNWGNMFWKTRLNTILRIRKEHIVLC